MRYWIVKLSAAIVVAAATGTSANAQAAGGNGLVLTTPNTQQSVNSNINSLHTAPSAPVDPVTGAPGSPVISGVQTPAPGRHPTRSHK